MAVALIYMNLLVPVQTIREKYPGGWQQCLQDHKQEIERGRVWFDDHLFHDGAMGSQDIELLISKWEKRGFQSVKVVDGHTQWADLCCLEYAGHLMPDWLELGPHGHSAYPAGTDPGETVTPENGHTGLAAKDDRRATAKGYIGRRLVPVDARSPRTTRRNLASLPYPWLPRPTPIEQSRQVTATRSGWVRRILGQAL